MRFAVILIISVFCLVSFTNVGSVPAEDAKEKQQGTATEEDTARTGDLDKKIDTTIEILKVIKEELQETESSAKPVVKGEEKAEWSDTLRKVISRISRIWKKVRKITASGDKKTQQTAAILEDRAEWNRDLSDKLDKTIEAMKVMKEELDKIEENKNE
jgi:hypothetical protein